MRTSRIAGTAMIFVPFSVIVYLLCLLFGITGWVQLPAVVAFGATLAFV